MLPRAVTERSGEGRQRGGARTSVPSLASARCASFLFSYRPNRVRFFNFVSRAKRNFPAGSRSQRLFDRFQQRRRATGEVKFGGRCRSGAGFFGTFFKGEFGARDGQNAISFFASFEGPTFPAKSLSFDFATHSAFTEGNGVNCKFEWDVVCFHLGIACKSRECRFFAGRFDRTPESHFSTRCFDSDWDIFSFNFSFPLVFFCARGFVRLAQRRGRCRCGTDGCERREYDGNHSAHHLFVTHLYSPCHPVREHRFIDYLPRAWIQQVRGELFGPSSTSNHALRGRKRACLDMTASAKARRDTPTILRIISQEILINSLLTNADASLWSPYPPRVRRSPGRRRVCTRRAAGR